MLTLQFALESAVCGLVLALIGNGIIALWRGAVATDACLLSENAGLRQLLVDRDGFDLATEAKLAAKVRGLSDDAKSVLRLVLERGRADDFVAMNACALSLEAAQGAMGELIYAVLVEKGGGKNQFSVPPEYKAILKRLLRPTS